MTSDEPANIIEQANTLIERANKLHADGRVDEALDLIIDFFDDHFLCGIFTICNSVLKDVDVGSCPTDILLVLLMVSRWAVDQLPARKDFVESAKEEITINRGEPLDLLDGLL
jgi:hypothetical protein